MKSNTPMARNSMVNTAVDEETASRIREGYQPRLKELAETMGPGGGRVKLVKGLELVALAELVEGPGSLGKQVRLLRVFH